MITRAKYFPGPSIKKLKQNWRVLPAQRSVRAGARKAISYQYQLRTAAPMGQVTGGGSVRAGLLRLARRAMAAPGASTTALMARPALPPPSKTGQIGRNCLLTMGTGFDRVAPCGCAKKRFPISKRRHRIEKIEAWKTESATKPV